LFLGYARREGITKQVPVEESTAKRDLDKQKINNKKTTWYRYQKYQNFTAIETS